MWYPLRPRSSSVFRLRSSLRRYRPPSSRRNLARLPDSLLLTSVSARFHCRSISPLSFLYRFSENDTMRSPRSVGGRRIAPSSDYSHLYLLHFNMIREVFRGGESGELSDGLSDWLVKNRKVLSWCRWSESNRHEVALTGF